MDQFRRQSVSRKTLLGILPLFLIFIAVSVALQNHFQERDMMEQAQEASRLYADLVREAMVSMMVSNLEVDETFLERINNLPQFDTLHILINDLRLREEVLRDVHPEKLAAVHKTRQPHDEREVRVLATGEADFKLTGNRFRGIVPIKATEVCQKCHAVPSGYVLGAADMHVSLERIAHAAAGNWSRSLIIFILFVLLIMGVATTIFSRFVSRPTAQLVRAASEISDGNMGYNIFASYPDFKEPSPRKSADELTILAHRFEEMRKALSDKIAQIDRANRDLADRNLQLEEALAQLRDAQAELLRAERLATTGKLTAQLSHEINNPIHNIQSLLESSLRKLPPDVQPRELIAIAFDEITRMSRLTRQMLGFFRTSMMDLEENEVDLRELLRDVGRTHAEAFRNCNISIDLEMPATVPLVRGSADKLKQVVLNLILNARDAMPDGGKLSLHLQPTGSEIQIIVSDTGVGIPPHHLDKIFDAFFSTKKEVSGVGLGLSVSYGIVQQHMGRIAVQSEVNKGTTFTVTLPVIGTTHG